MKECEHRAHCTVCNRFADKTTITEDYMGNIMQVNVQCHGQSWQQSLPIFDVYRGEFINIIVPPATKQLT